MRTRDVIGWLWAVLFLGLVSSFPQASRQQQIESHKHQAAEFLREKKLDSAADEFRAILAIDPKDADARGNLGVVLFFQGNYRDAIPQLRAALKLEPTAFKIQALLGIAEKRSGQVDAARVDLEKAFPKVSEEGIRIETGMELIDIYSASRDLDKAGAIVGKLRELKPADEAILYSAYRLYSDLAAESLLSLTVVAPNSARTHQALAHEFAERGNTKEAIDQYQEALKINPQLPGLHFELADMLRASGSQHASEAEAEYKAALQVNPRDEQAQCRLGEIAVQRNDLTEAEQLFTKAVELQPNDPEASIGLAKVQMALGKPEKAEPLLAHALQLDPTSAVAHFRLSAVYRQLGRPADAQHEIEEYKKYKKMKEKLQEIYRNMGTDEGAEEHTEPQK